jgi:hypothetical protein
VQAGSARPAPTQQQDRRSSSGAVELTFCHATPFKHNWAIARRNRRCRTCSKPSLRTGDIGAIEAKPPVASYSESDKRLTPSNASAAPAESLLAPKNFLQKRLSRKGCPFLGRKPFLATLLGKGQETILKIRKGPPGGLAGN